MHRPPARITVGLAFAFACTGSAAAQDAETPVPCAQRLQASLQRLVDLPESLWRFVILEEPRSGNFIQFAWWDGVVVDLPLVALDAEQEARASRVFEQLGAGTPVLERGTDDVQATPTRTFQHDFGRDTAAAARFGCAAFLAVYPLSGDLPLEVVVGGD